MTRIAVDAMGSDNYPTPDVEGAVMAAREYGVEILLVGDASNPSASTRDSGVDPSDPSCLNSLLQSKSMAWALAAAASCAFASSSDRLLLVRPSLMSVCS